MKNKLSKIMGIGFALVLIASMMLFAIPAAAAPYAGEFAPVSNMWTGYAPQAGIAGGWFFDPTITQVGPLAQAINGDIYAHVQRTTPVTLVVTNDIFKSTDGGRSWTVSTIPNYYFNTNTLAPGGAVVDMVCSSVSEDVLYLTDGNYVYKSINGGLSFTLVAAANLELHLMGACGTGIVNWPITSIDVGYNGAGQPVVFIGTKNAGNLVGGNQVIGSVYWIADETFSAMWIDLQVSCFAPACYTAGNPAVGDYDVYAVATAPGFANVSKIYAVVTAPLTRITFPTASTAVVEIRAGDTGANFTITDTSGQIFGGDIVQTGAPPLAAPNTTMTFTGQGTSVAPGIIDIAVTDGTISWRVVAGVGTADATFCGGTRVLSNLGTVCNWNYVSELRWNCTWSFEIEHASRIVFPGYYSTDPTLFVGVVGVEDFDASPATYDGFGEGGDVYRVADTFPLVSSCIDLNIQGFTTGCTGFYHANICSLDLEADALLAGAWDIYQQQSPTRVYYSADGGWTWAPSIKDPTGTDRAYVLFGSAVAGTRGCDCAFSLDCGANPGQFFNQISLISMDIDQVLDLTHAPGYLDGASTMYVLSVGDDTKCCADAFTVAATSINTVVTVTVNAGAVMADVFADVAPLGNIVITNPHAFAPQVCTITLPDVGDTVLVTAVDSATNVTTVVSAGGANIAKPAFSDCDGDMTPIWGTFLMPDAAVRSLCRWDGTYWERVHSSRYYAVGPTPVLSGFMNGPLYDWVEVSPDFNTTDCVYMANTGFFLARSMDAGCSWVPLTYPCFNRPNISAWIVVDMETVLTAGQGAAAGNVYRTQNHGSQPWKIFPVLNSLGLPACCGVDFDLSPNIATDNSVLLGDACGQVFVSQDLAATWVEIEDALEVGNTIFPSQDTYVVFDPGYGTDGDPGVSMIYAAAGSDIGRCSLDLAGALPTKQDWVQIYAGLGMASGIDAAGDTCLYVADMGSVSGVSRTVTVSGSFTIYGLTSGVSSDIIISTPVPVTELGGTSFIHNELVSLTGSNFVVTSPTTIVGTLAFTGLTSGATGTGSISITGVAGFTTGEGVIVMTSVLTTAVTGTGLTAIPTGVVRSLNPMDLVTPTFNLVVFERLVNAPTIPGPASLVHPPALSVFPDDLWLTAGSNVLWALDSGNPTTIWVWDDPLATPVIQIAPASGALLVTTTTAALEWEALDGATNYEIKVYAACPECLNPLEMKELTTSPYNTAATCITITDLTPGTQYFWKVRVASGHPFLSKWSELRSFDTALGAVPYLCSPICGADNIIINTNFSWDAVLGATSYEVQIATDEAFANIVSSGTTSVNAWTPAAPLEYSTVYYWRVRAVNDGIYSAWAVCIFTTADAPVTPPDPEPAVIVEQTEITPAWIWVIIGIGGALTIAVVVLIVTTRRVP